VEKQLDKVLRPFEGAGRQRARQRGRQQEKLYVAAYSQISWCWERNLLGVWARRF
jgi:hypothetical protein